MLKGPVTFIKSVMTRLLKKCILSKVFAFHSAVWIDKALQPGLLFLLVTFWHYLEFSILCLFFSLVRLP